MMPTLPLDKMSVEEKIRTMEALWNDLCKHADGVPSPGWHADILSERDAAVERGEEDFEDWDTAKENIKKQIP